MAISRILGASLVSNLDREGVDLQFTTSGNSLVYMDFANFYLGVNTNAPNQPLHVVGNILVADGNVIASANLTADLGDPVNWFRDLYVGNVNSNNLLGTVQTADQPYITSLGTLSALSVTGNVSAGNISTTGTMEITGDLSVDDITANTFTGNVITANQPYITTLSNITVDSLTTAGNVSADYVIANVFSGGDIYGTIQTTNQPFITNLGNITVDSISIGGNITITGNTSGGIINADELYEAGYRVLTTNTNIVVDGDVVGSGTYSNVYVELTDTGVVAGVYGAADDETWDRIPKITVDSKGRITNIANVTLTQVGNVTFIDTTVSTTSNLTLAPAGGYIFANNSIIGDVADPVSNQDVVTLAYLNNELATVSAVMFQDDSSITVIDNGVDPGVISTVVDGNVVSNVSASSFDIYNTLNVGNLTINDVTISSTGNIFLDAQGNGIIQISGTDALGIPAGGVGDRPSAPEVGYTRFNTDTGVLETWDGTAWYSPGTSTITSEMITPDGLSNAFTLSSSVNSAYAVLVSINGTLQQPVTSYDVTGNVITFTETPQDTDLIEVRTISSGITVTGLQYGSTTLSLTTGNINTNSNILPTSDSMYDLGSNSLRWRDLHLSGSSIYLGNIILKGNSGVLQVYADDGVTQTSLQASDPVNLQDVVTLNYLQTQLSNFDTTTIIADDTQIQIIDDGVDAGNIVIAVDGSNVARVGADRVNLYKDLEVTGNVLADQYQYANGVNILTSVASSIANVEASLVSNVSSLTANAGAQASAISSIQTNYAQLAGATFTGAISAPGLTLSSTPLALTSGGTGATTSSDALNNLLPSGEQTGYVLKTAGAGTYYWASESGGGGTTVGQQLTTLRQSNVATSGQTLFELVNGIQYTPGAGQLRVYIDGVRQFTDAYTETSANTYTLSSGVTAGAVVFAEIDQFSSFNNYANLVYASNIGNIQAVGLTVQNAIESLENNKAPLNHPVFLNDITVNGNIYLGGSSTYVSANNLTLTDSLIYLADNNPTDNIDTGFVGSFNNGTYQHTGFARDASDGIWKLFANVVPEPTTTIDFTHATYSDLRIGKLLSDTATLTGNISAGNVIATNLVGSITSSQVTTALGYTPYNGLTNPNGYLTSLTSGQITTALGYTPYNGNTNPNGYLTSLTSGQITTALGYTPYNGNTNPNGYITAVPNSSTQVSSLGVGTAASGTTGEIRATNNITAFYSSDARFKENVRDIPNALDKVSAIGGKLFDWTDEYIETHGGLDGYFLTKESFGVIAQDVKEVFPEAVRTREDGYLAVDYERMCVLAFQAIKELSNEIKELKKKYGDIS